MADSHPGRPGPPDDTGTTNTALSADSKYDDQGLFFSLMLCGVLLSFYIPLVCYLVGTSKLWLKRFYRPNHTVEPPPREVPTAATAGGASPNQQLQQQGRELFTAGSFPVCEVDDSVTGREREGASNSQPAVAHIQGREGASQRTLQAPPPDARRRKRLGISLPYRSTLFQLPSWRDLISVEERVPHLEPALSQRHVTHVVPARFTGSRSYIPLSPARRHPNRYGNNGQHTSHGGGGGSPSSTVAAEDVVVHTARVASHTPTTPLSPFSLADGNCDSNHNNGSCGRPISYGTADSPSQAASASASAAAAMAAAEEEELPKTPLDPQVALYIFTLKFFAAVMILGGCFTVWISVISSEDEYNEYTMVKIDPKRCHRHDANETSCLLKRPYCDYLGEELGCTPVPLHGLYDLTVKNISPGSWRWWPVVLLNAGFCVVLVSLTVLYVRRVSAYVSEVMAHQMEHALGYRVACVRGVGEADTKSVSAFSHSFLDQRSYFLPPVRRPNNNNGNGSAGGSSTHREDDVHDEFDYYEQMDCNGLDCLFSVVGCHYYATHRTDAVFTRPGKVKQILFTRKPPTGMYSAISGAESTMADMQDIVADEKAIKRKLFRQQRKKAVTAHPHQQQHSHTHTAEATTTTAAATATTTSPPSSATQQQRVVVNRSVIFSLVHLRSPTTCSSTSSGQSSFVEKNLPPVAVPVTTTSKEEVEQERQGDTRGVAYTECSVLEADDNVEDLQLYTRTSLFACCNEVPAIPFYEQRLRKAAEVLNRKLAEVPQQPADSATFVVFADARSAFEFANLFKACYGGFFSNAVVNIAGPPGQVISNNMLADKCALGLRFFLVFCVYVVLVFSYSIPIGMLGSLENLSYVPGIGSSFSEYYIDTVPDWLRDIINAYLPVLALALFYVILPDIVRFMVVSMGAFNKTECDAGQLYLQYIFMVLTAVIFQAALQGGLAQLAFLVSAGEGRFIAEFFVSCVTPNKVGYFYAKVLMAIGFTAWNDVVDPVGILKALLLRGHVHVQRNYDALFMPCELEFPRRYSFDLMILAIGLLFHMTMPLLGWFVALFFVVRYFTQRTRLYDRYRPTLSPAQDCTDFTVCAQVLRCVMWLFCLAETGGVLLLSVREHTGGVVVCSLTLGTGLLLLVYVHLQTSRWIASLGRARDFARAKAQRHEVYQQQQRAQRRHEAAVVSSREEGGDASGGNGSGSRQREESSVASLAGSLNSIPSSPRARGRSETEQEAQEQAEFARKSQQDDDEAAAYMDSYENLRFTLFDDSHSNPFIGYLLPRIPDVSCRYQPKHQRIAPLDVDAELVKMKRSVFVVERYWDRGMTWFEADVAEHQPSNATKRTRHHNHSHSPAQRRECRRVRSLVVEPADAHNEGREDKEDTSSPLGLVAAGSATSYLTASMRCLDDDGDEELKSTANSGVQQQHRTEPKWEGEGDKEQSVLVPVAEAVGAEQDKDAHGGRDVKDEEEEADTLPES